MLKKLSSCVRPGVFEVRALYAQGVKQPGRQPRVERQAVVAVRRPAPLAQAPAQGVGADHAIAAAQMPRQRVHVTPGARQPVPGDHHGGIGCAPFGVVDFVACTGGVA